MRHPVLSGLSLSVLLLAGCGSPYPVRQQPPAPIQSSREAAPPPAPTQSSREAAPPPAQGAAEVHAYRPPQPRVAMVRAPSSRAVRRLMQRAASQRRSGDYAAAQASLERALRIEPRNPRLWNRLARVSLLQRAYARAEQFAAKSNALIQADDVLMADNWSLIAQARRARGDRAGAREAERQVRSLEY